MCLPPFKSARGPRQSGSRLPRKRGNRAEPGLTVADLKGRCRRAGRRQLSDLIVGKTVSVRNTVTGQQFEIRYGTDGCRLIASVDGKPLPPTEVGDILHSGELGSPAQYEIRTGELITTLEGIAFTATVYKTGETTWRHATTNSATLITKLRALVNNCGETWSNAKRAEICSYYPLSNRDSSGDRQAMAALIVAPFSGDQSCRLQLNRDSENQGFWEPLPPVTTPQKERKALT